MDNLDDPSGSIILSVLSYLTPTHLIGLGVVLFLLIFSALISGSEVAFFSINQEDAKKLKDSGSLRDNRIVRLLEHPQRLLATILILNNLVNIAIVTISTYLMWSITGTQTPEGQVIVIVTAIVTFVIAYFGEVVPKVYANQRNIPFAHFTVNFIFFSDIVLKPFSFVLTRFSRLVENRIKKRGYDLSINEIGEALEIAGADSHQQEKDILKGIVNFGNLTVKQVMRSRIDIVSYDIELDFHELLETINTHGYSRVPVYRETIDKIEGVLYIKDILPYLDKPVNFNWQELMRPGFFIPENKKIDSLLRDFQEKRVHMAIVVDEYGGTSGLITLEDIIEEIVGEINDEFDDNEIAYNKLDDSTYIFEGKTTLNDFCKVIDEDISIFDEVKGESESLGGLLLELNTKLPRVGDKINYGNFVFTAVSVDQRRIKTIRVLIKSKTQAL